MARLAGGTIVAAGEAAWTAGPDGQPTRLGRGAVAPGGAPVAIGPAVAPDTTVKAALDELDHLIVIGGAAAAGAGVDLGHGFTSARLAGAPGERRDWVLAALRALWPDGASRLGDRPSVVVALFGPRATKRLGAALARAADDGRWAAIHLAVAASDLLGPERVERLLALEAPPGTEPVPGGEPSTLAGFLDEALGPLPETRRATLLHSLWDRVVEVQAATGSARRRRERLLAGQDGDDALEPARAQRRRVDDEWIVTLVTDAYGRAPSVAEAARWIPPRSVPTAVMVRVFEDAVAATALARLAVAAADGDIEAALAGHLELLIQGACPGISGAARSQLRRLRGPYPEAGRPGHAAATIAAAAILATQPGAGRPVQIRGAVLDPARLEDFVRRRLATARTHGIVTLEQIRLHLSGEWPHGGPRWDALTAKLHPWRQTAGYGPARPPQAWHHPPHGGAGPALAERTAAHPSLPIFAVETADDLLWFADLGDAVAALHGHAAAAVAVPWGSITVDVDPSPPEPEPLRPRVESVPAAVAGAAQLIRLGAEIPARPRSWDDLSDRLLASAGIAELLVSEFPVPAGVLAQDGSPLPGTDLVVDVARTARQLADWSAVMGNCIASYAEEGHRGSSLLLALRPPTGPVRFNAELCRSRGGWRIEQLLGRFNTDPPDDVTAAVRAWVATLPAPPAVRPPAPRRAVRGRGGPRRRSRPTPAVMAARTALADACDARLDPALAAAVAPLGVRLGWHADGDAFGALTALRRTPLPRLVEAVGDALADGWASAQLWAATGSRPLAAALADLDDAARRALPDVEPLLRDGPLPAGTRPTARLVPVARARGVEVGLRRVRGAVGVLLRRADPRLDAALAAAPALGPLCAAVLAVTAWDGSADAVERPVDRVALSEAGEVPGVPSSRLLDEDGPWAPAWSGAHDLGAPLDRLRLRAESGELTALVVPTAWVGRRGWPTLWARAHRTARSA